MYRLRNLLQQVDTYGRENRRYQSIQRRIYLNPGPHHVWHIDGCHKLKSVKLVVHGAMDGFSRTVVFLKCSDNNRAATVFELFKESVQQYGCSSRTDKRKENTDIATFMIRVRGTNRGSIITGQSCRNQLVDFFPQVLVERLWQDVQKEVLHYYQDIIECLINVHAVDFDNPSCLYTFQHLFINHLLFFNSIYSQLLWENIANTYLLLFSMTCCIL